MMLNIFRTPASYCLLTAITAFTLSCNRSAPAAEEDMEAKTPVTVVTAAIGPVTSTIDLTAVSMFMNKNIVRATTTGTIEKISINQGDQVTGNQQLFTIRTREAMALKNSAGNDTSLTFKGLINIVSGKAGIISSVAFQKGDFVQEGDELAVISDQNSLVFILDVPFEYVKYIGKNRNCIIVLQDNSKVRGYITGKLPEMDMLSQTIRYIVKPSSMGNLPGNLIARISLIKSENSRAVILPKNAVLSNETQTEFWIMKVINDSTAVKVIVSKGFENNDEVEITDPHLLPSERIILTGNYGLPDTARITIVKN